MEALNADKEKKKEEEKLGARMKTKNRFMELVIDYDKPLQDDKTILIRNNP